MESFLFNSMIIDESQLGKQHYYRRHLGILNPKSGLTVKYNCCKKNWVHIGCGLFDASHDFKDIKCVDCGKTGLTITKCLFINCKVKWQGITNDNENKNYNFLARSYKITDDNMRYWKAFIIKIVSYSTFNVFIKNISGITINYIVNDNTTTLQLKEMIEKEDKISIDHQRLIYGSIQLNDTYKLIWYGVGHESTIYMMPRLYGD